MFYRIQGEHIQEIAWEAAARIYEEEAGKSEEEKARSFLAGYLSPEEFAACLEPFGIPQSCLEECDSGRPHFGGKLEVYEEYSFGLMEIIDIVHIREKRDRAALLLKRGMFLFVRLEDEDRHTEKLFQETIMDDTKNRTMEKFLYFLLMDLIREGNVILGETQEKIVGLEKELLDGKPGRDLNRKAFEMKRNLLLRKRYYGDLIDIGETLQEDANGIFTGTGALRYFKIFTDKARRLSRDTQTLCDSLVHLQDAYTASLEYSLNTIMKMFTLVTVIFLPLTLIVGWYGMNFTTMPELTWRYGYLFVICLCVAVVAVCLWVFRKKKLL